MLERIENKLGIIDIERPVATKIIKDVVMKHKDVYAITNNKGQTISIWNRWSVDKNKEFIVIRKDKQGRIRIDIYLILYFGVPITSVSQKIIQNVRNKLKEYLELSPESIYIHVAGLKSKNIVERDIVVKG